MGMFDSLLVEINGKGVELQTKRFYQNLNRYQLGSVIKGAQPGISVYIDTVYLDQQGKQLYIKAEDTSIYTVFVVIAHGVFVDYEVVEEEMSYSCLQKEMKRLKDKWLDTARLLEFFVAVLTESQDKSKALQGKIANSLNIIEKAKQLRAGQEVSEFLDLDKSVSRLKQGEDPLKMVESILEGGKEEIDIWSEEEGFSSDPLQPYRL